MRVVFACDQRVLIYNLQYIVASRASSFSQRGSETAPANCTNRPRCPVHKYSRLPPETIFTKTINPLPRTGRPATHEPSCAAASARSTSHWTLVMPLYICPPWWAGLARLDVKWVADNAVDIQAGQRRTLSRQGKRGLACLEVSRCKAGGRISRRVKCVPWRTPRTCAPCSAPPLRGGAGGSEWGGKGS